MPHASSRTIIVASAYRTRRGDRQIEQLHVGRREVAARG